MGRRLANIVVLWHDAHFNDLIQLRVFGHRGEVRNGIINNPNAPGAHTPSQQAPLQVRYHTQLHLTGYSLQQIYEFFLKLPLPSKFPVLRIPYKSANVLDDLDGAGRGFEVDLVG